MTVRLSAPHPVQNDDRQCSALIINSSHEMAKEITLQITLSMPGCSIMYAPTIEVAKWILSRRHVDLIVSSELLPDGPVSRLDSILTKLPHPADLIVVRAAGYENSDPPSQNGYRMVTQRRIATKNVSTPLRTPIIHRPTRTSEEKAIRSLGADIRNDLNNPLQAIVAMVFVAKSSQEITPSSQCALDAIERAAMNMSQIVQGLEEKIRNVVG